MVDRHCTGGRPAEPMRPDRAGHGVRLDVLRRYFLAMAPGSLLWEFAHMPLYTLWETGSWGQIVFAAIHCTGGDILIAAGSLAAALFLVGGGGWPARRYMWVAAVAVVIGVAFTVVSESVNIEIRRTWAYRDLMPVLPVVGTGVSPFAQWIILPSLAFWWAGRSRGRQ